MSFKQIQESGILLQVLPLLPLKDLLLSATLVNKRFCEHSIFQLLVHKSGIDRARLPPDAKDQLVEIMTIARKLIIREKLVVLPPHLNDAVLKANSLHILAQDPNTVIELMRINASVYTHWNAAPGNPNMGLYNILLDMLKEHIEHEYDRDLYHILLRDGKYWGTSRLQGNFIFLFDRPDGSILVSSDYKHVYLVLGLAQTFGEVANLGYRNGDFYRKPDFPMPRMHSLGGAVQITTTLLNWGDKIVWDGIFTPYNMLTKAMLKNALNAYAKAYNAGSIVSQLTLVEPVQKVAALSAEELEVLASAARDDLAVIMSQPKADATHISWLFERHGLTEQTNPAHFMIARTGGGFAGDYVITRSSAALDATPLEYIKNLREVAENRGMRPEEIRIDSEPAEAALKHILGKVKIDVFYEPPPSAEEQSLLALTNRTIESKLIHTPNPRCGLCRARHCHDGTPLLACSACKSVHYCCREHQKKDWKMHKNLCMMVQEVVHDADMN